MSKSKAFPILVQCYGNRYEAKSEIELDHLTMLLIKGYKARANMYRVGETRESDEATETRKVTRKEQPHRGTPGVSR